MNHGDSFRHRQLNLSSPVPTFSRASCPKIYRSIILIVADFVSWCCRTARSGSYQNFFRLQLKICAHDACVTEKGTARVARRQSPVARAAASSASLVRCIMPSNHANPPAHTRHSSPPDSSSRCVLLRFVVHVPETFGITIYTTDRGKAPNLSEAESVV